jgi:hypothetical protein
MPRHVGAKFGFVCSADLKLVSAPFVSPFAYCWTPVLYDAAESGLAPCLSGVAYGSTGPLGLVSFLASSSFF